jgi:hypothetical protein
MKSSSHKEATHKSHNDDMAYTLCCSRWPTKNLVVRTLLDHHTCVLNADSRCIQFVPCHGMIRTPVLEKATNASSVQGLSSHHQCLLLLMLLLHPQDSHKKNKKSKGRSRRNNNNKNSYQNDRSCNCHDAIVVLLRLLCIGRCPKTRIISATSHK